MKNPGLGQKAKSAGSPHKFGIAGEFKGQDSVSRGRKAIGPDGSPAKKKGEKDLSMAVEGTGSAKKAERERKREARKAEKQRAKDVKRHGGEEKHAAYEEKAAGRQEKREQYKIDKGDVLAKQGKGYMQEDEGGDRHYVRAERGGTDAVTGATSRETMKRLEASKGKTAEQHAQEAKDYFANKRAEREASESEAPLTKKKKSALKNYKKGYYGAK